MHVAITSQSTVAPAAQQVSCEVTGEIVILNLQSGNYYGLDGVGARIWGLLNEPRTVDSLRGSLLAEYDVEPEQCETELLVLLRTLIAEGLLEIRNDATP